MPERTASPEIERAANAVAVLDDSAWADLKAAEDARRRAERHVPDIDTLIA